MRHPRIVIGTLVLATGAAVAGVAVASASGSSGGTSPAAGGVVHTASAAVGGTTETILEDGHGLPVYIYQPDTATASMVNGGLASLWPAVTSTAPAAPLAGGQLSSLPDQHGSQVTYNGHLLYTFVSDQPGMVTGQGVHNFVVATPGLTPLAGAPAPAPAPANSAPSYGGSYGY